MENFPSANQRTVSHEARETCPLLRFQEGKDTDAWSSALSRTQADNMALNTSPEHIDIQTSDNFDEFLMKVQEGKKGEVASFLSRLIGSEGTEAELRGDDSSKDLSKKLGDALQENDVVKVWRLIAEASENETSKTLAALNEVCKDVAEKEKKKEGCCKFFCERLFTTLKDSISWILSCNGDDIDEETEMRSENEQAWIKILSNPLYISLEWLWRNNPEARQGKESRSSERKTTDVIEAALHDAYLLKKIASYEHHYSRDEYKNRAKEYEKFAADIVEQISASDSAQLHKIMDINGNGSLLTKKHENFNESLSLLKMAADKQRKLVSIVSFN